MTFSFKNSIKTLIINPYKGFSFSDNIEEWKHAWKSYSKDNGCPF